MAIHPTAVVSGGAQIHETAEIGPYVVIDEGVRIGAGTRIGPFVHILGLTTIGQENVIHSHVVIGDRPQHTAYDGRPRRVVIGDRNVIREHVTIHRPYEEEAETRIGNDCFFMVSSHVGHDSIVGDGVIMTNGSMLGGHVTVSERAIISGNASVHQFVRIGRFAMMQGLSGLSKDLPPFCVVRGINNVAGLNTVGLRRAGFSPAARQEIKQAYRILFREGNSIPRALEMLRVAEFGPEVAEMIDFIESSKRGVIAGRGEE
ncbi:acyl-ACP--UDP-N-acetylglucosamine O-acyltransferase [bacterium]|nr:acyl-ACP--UDP-N-acetylglucosamine O-acyltransferase [bacterium]